MSMATYTVDGTKVGATLQAGAGTLVSVQMTTAPTGRSEQAFDGNDGVPTSGYLALVDSSTSPRRRLFSIHQDNGALGMRQTVALNGASFSSLVCSAVPIGASYTVVTTP
jgi:hypothetical protein